MHELVKKNLKFWYDHQLNDVKAKSYTISQGTPLSWVTDCENASLGRNSNFKTAPLKDLTIILLHLSLKNESFRIQKLPIETPWEATIGMCGKGFWIADM